MHKTRADGPDHPVSHGEYDEDKAPPCGLTDGAEASFWCAIMRIMKNKQGFGEECFDI